MNDNAKKVVLSNRLFLFRYVARAFARTPDEEFVVLILNDQTMEQCVLLDDDAAERRSAQGGICESIDGGPNSLARLAGEYTKLFEGPAKLPVSLWESTYVCGESLLFQENTLAVREAYLKEGFRAAGYPHEADDHLATELNFAAALADRAARAYEFEDIELLKKTLAAHSRFLEEHLLVWVRGFSDRLNEVDGVSSFYPSFAALAALVCERDAEIIEELLAAM